VRWPAPTGEARMALIVTTFRQSAHDGVPAGLEAMAAER
jgi:hypothetical protein